MAHVKKLSPIHHQAIALRLTGLTYAEIGERLHRTEGTVSVWFTGDPLFKAEFEARKAANIELARTIVENAAVDAARVLAGLIYSEHTPSALNAAKDILDRAGMKPADKIEATIDDGSFSDDERATRIAALLDRARARRVGQSAGDGDAGDLEAATGSADGGV